MSVAFGLKLAEGLLKADPCSEEECWLPIHLQLVATVDKVISLQLEVWLATLAQDVLFDWCLSRELQSLVAFGNMEAWGFGVTRSCWS